MNMTTSLNKYTFALFLLLIGVGINAQQINWNDTPGETFVYEISNKEAEKLLRSDPQDSLMLKMLHTPVTSFRGVWEHEPEKGHFIFARIHKNKVYYRYAPVIPFQVFLFREYGILTLQVVDSDGEIRSDAKVRIKGLWRIFDTGIYFDKVSKTYTIDDQSEKEDRLLTVELEGFTVMFNLSKHFVNPWYGGDDYRREGPRFYSYMITDKNKYKPGETVRFKSYALSGRRRPLKEEVDIVVNGKKIKQVLPYNPGGYAGEVFLHDSLKLQLDRRYNIQISDRKGRVVANANFEYEDYELYDSRIETKLTSFNHYDPDTNRLEIKTLDANGLFLQDMKAEISIRRNAVSASFTDLLVLPDILMYKTIDLDNSGPTTVDIPSSLFGESNCSYTVYVKAYTYDNQVLMSSNSATFYKSRYNILYFTRNDTICFDFEELGRKKPVQAKIWYDNKREYKEVKLPYEEPFRQSVDSYHIQIEKPAYSSSVRTSQIGSKLDIEGGIQTDSFNVRLVNPLNLDVSWYIYQGNILIDKGSGKEFDFKYPNTNLDVTHYVELFYFLGSNEEVYRRTFIPKTEFLDVDIDLPERVYPGQKLEATVSVKDNLGKPVKGVDLTAFAYNSQLGYNVPDLPYYGPSPQYREQRTSYSISGVDPSDFNVPLDYDYWKTKAGLDTMKYYQFTYPLGKLFRHEIETPDSVTQFAPFVMKNGESVHVYVVELNGEPVYFSWTEQPQRYSFVVPDDTAMQKIAIRLHDRVVVLDSVCFTPNKKTILSMDIDSLPLEKVRYLTFASRSFTSQEQQAYNYYISRVPVLKNYDFTYLRDTLFHIIYPLYHRCLQPPKSNVLVGPVPGGKRMMQYCDSLIYRHEGGFRYEYEDNVVYKYPEQTFPSNLSFSSDTYFRNLNDFALTPSIFSQLVEKCKIETDNWRPSNILIVQNGLNLNFKIAPHQDTTGVSNMLFRDIYTDSLIFPNQIEYGTRKYGPIPVSTYDVILLYNSGRYICFDSIEFKQQHYIEADLTKLPLQECDSISRKWLALRTRIIQPEYTHDGYTSNSSRSSYYERSLIVRRVPSANAVKGVVKDDTGEPLIGVSIIVKGTHYGTITDLDGNFEIEIDEDEATLIFSYIGYNTQEVRVQKGSLVDIVMGEELSLLEEVVVVGYGVQKKYSLTGSISSIKTDDLSRSGEAPQEIPDADEGDGDDEDREAEERLYNELLQLNGLRSNFSDVGFWEPQLVTDKKGKAQFTVTFPDNITQWNAVVYAMNRKLKTGTTRKYIKSYKPLMAELKNPQFLVVGDSSYYAGNIRNYTYGEQEIKGLVTFAVGQDTVMRNDIRFVSSHQDKILVSPVVTDSLTTTYMFRRDDGYNDGEQRTIPVIRQGTEIAEGTLEFLRNGDKKEVMAKTGEEIRVTVAAKQLDIYMDAVSYLHGYEYACNEQLASKLIGLLNYKLYTQYTGEKFKYDKKVNQIIKRLTENQNENMLWSWWGNSSVTSFWMSAHIIRALEMAHKDGYSVNLNFKRIEQDYTDMKRYRTNSLYDLDIVSALSEAGTEQNYEGIINFFQKEIERQEYIADSVARENKYTNTRSFLKERLQLLELRQRHQLAYSPDSLTKYLRKDVLGAVYCDDGKQSYYWYSDNMMATLIAYRIVDKDSTLHHLKEPMQMYVLGTKRNYWNTYQASSAVMTILPDLIAESATPDIPASVLLSGKDNELLTKFPYEVTLMPGEHLAIEKQSGMPLIYSAYKMIYVTEKNAGDAFNISTELSSGDRITAGVPVTLKVTVEVKQKNAEHVMIEVPIPAGCSYSSKRQNYYWGYGRETYRESFKEKTVIFCENLPQGTYSFEIELLPRYTGRYTLNPAKAEMMYFPVINSNNDLRKIEIEERK
jgi:hypothetical protein